MKGFDEEPDLGELLEQARRDVDDLCVVLGMLRPRALKGPAELARHVEVARIALGSAELNLHLAVDLARAEAAGE